MQSLALSKLRTISFKGNFPSFSSSSSQNAGAPASLVSYATPSQGIGAQGVENVGENKRRSILPALASSLLRFFQVAFTGAALGAAGGAVVGTVKPVPKATVGDCAADLYNLAGRNTPEIGAYLASRNTVNEALKTATDKEQVKVLQNNLKNLAEELYKNLIQTDKKDALFKEAKKTAKQYNRGGIIGAGIAVGTVACALFSVVKDFLPKRPTMALESSKTSLGTTQG
jgi:hypothetical protein